METVEGSPGRVEFDAMRLILAGIATVLSMFIAFLVLAKPGGNSLEVRVSMFALIALGCAAGSVLRTPTDRRLPYGLLVAFLMSLAFFAAGSLQPLMVTRPPTRSLSCLSNVKQLDLGLIMYSGDFDDKLPPHGVWRTGIEPYLKWDFRCPLETTPWTYAINENDPGKNDAKFKSPADLITVFEADAYEPNAEGGLDWFAPRHNGKGSTGFADGHARLCAPPVTGWLP